MNVYSFYEPLDEFSKIHQDQKTLIEIWKKSWRYYGWNPIIYGINECKLSEDYQSVYDACKKLPTVNIKKYELYCFLRWLYMGEVGGWYADTDMINYGFTPMECREKTATTSVALHCASIHCSKNGYKKIINEFKKLNENDPRHAMAKNKKHFSDMLILESIRDIDIKLDIQKEYVNKICRYAKVVHYPLGVLSNGKTRTETVLEDERTKIFI